MEDKKVFDDFPKVDCNECEPYWTGACDGVPVGSEKRCTAFKATRRVNIPEQIKSLRERVNGLNWAFLFLALSLLIYYLIDMFERFGRFGK